MCYYPFLNLTSFWEIDIRKEFNPKTELFNLMTLEETKEFILEMCANPNVAGLSILGGEPLNPKNIDEVTRLAKAFKERFPHKTIWLWSGYLYEDYIFDKAILKYIDVLVDGQFVEELKNLRIPYCGSENQRVIDVKKTKSTGKIVLYQQEV